MIETINTYNALELLEEGRHVVWESRQRSDVKLFDGLKLGWSKDILPMRIGQI